MGRRGKKKAELNCAVLVTADCAYCAIQNYMLKEFSLNAVFIQILFSLYFICQDEVKSKRNKTVLNLLNVLFAIYRKLYTPQGIL